MFREHVIARRGSQWLVKINEVEGRILDLTRRMYYPPEPVSTILAHGYWEPATADLAALKKQIP